MEHRDGRLSNPPAPVDCQATTAFFIDFGPV